MNNIPSLTPRTLRAAMAASLALTTSAWATNAPLSINFDDLTTGNLVGGSTWSSTGNQSNWYQVQGGASKVVDLTDHGKVVTSSGANVFNNYLNSSTFYTGTEKSAVLQFDAQLV